MIIPDVNLRVYAYNWDAPFHPRAQPWWEACVGGDQPVAIPWAVALGHLRRWLEQPSVMILHPGPRHRDLLAGFCETGALQSSLITDAHIAAMAIEYQAVVHSNDSDFSRFAGLRWIHPLEGLP